MSLLKQTASVPCENNTAGCHVQITLNQKEIHEKTCSYRRVKCVEIECPKLLRAGEFLDHIKSHDIKCLNSLKRRGQIDVDKEFFDCSSIQWGPDYFCHNEHHFFFHLVKYEKYLYAWVYVFCFPSKEIKVNYKYKFSIKANQGRIIIETCEDCIPLEEHSLLSISKISEFSNITSCFSIQTNIIQMLPKSNKLDFEVDIYKDDDKESIPDKSDVANVDEH